MGQATDIRKRVVIVDDSRTMQAVLEQLLSTRLHCEVVGIAGDGVAAIPMIRRLKPDLVTIDLAMPYIGGQELLKELAVFPEMRKVVISQTAFDNLAMKAGLERAGADGCICKSDMSRDPEQFCRMLSAVLRGPKKARAASTIPRTSAISGAEDAAAGGIDAVSAIVSYPTPVDERERLIALAALGLANDDPDHRLDLLTQHLVNTTSFSACVMTFIDHHRQWVKSACGFERGSMERPQAICNYTICSDEPFIVEDTRADKRFHKLDAVVSGPMIRSYVGHPIVAASGVRLGSICLLDTRARRVSVKELTNLRSIARIAAELIEGPTAPGRRAA